MRRAACVLLLCGILGLGLGGAHSGLVLCHLMSRSCCLLFLRSRRENRWGCGVVSIVSVLNDEGGSLTVPFCMPIHHGFRLVQHGLFRRSLPFRS
jgi:hypothetical protein